MKERKNEKKRERILQFPDLNLTKDFQKYNKLSIYFRNSASLFSFSFLRSSESNDEVEGDGKKKKRKISHNRRNSTSSSKSKVYWILKLNSFRTHNKIEPRKYFIVIFAKYLNKVEKETNSCASNYSWIQITLVFKFRV